MTSVANPPEAIKKSRHHWSTAFFISPRAFFIKPRALFMLPSLLFIVLLAGCAKQDNVYRLSGSTMGTHYRVTLVAGEAVDKAYEQQLVAGIEEILEQIESEFSTYRPDSVLSRWNQLGEGECQLMSANLREVLALSLEIAEHSQGYFNPLVGSLVNRWGFGPLQREAPPDAAELEELLQLSQLSTINYDAESGELCKLVAGTQLDFSAIAKGYAVDQVASLLQAQGFGDVLVDIGGELKAVGSNPQGQLWRLAIEKPENGGQSVHAVVQLSGLGVATSGDYRNYYEVDGQRFSHTIDPHSGYPVRHQLASVTVIAASVAVADAWATAMLAAGPEHARKWALQHELAIYLIERENTLDGSLPGPGYSSWPSPTMLPLLTVK